MMQGHFTEVSYLQDVENICDKSTVTPSTGHSNSSVMIILERLVSAYCVLSER